MKTIFYFLIVIFTVVGCENREQKTEDITNFNKLDWMLGIWKGNQGEADIYESWRKKSFRIMEGISYTSVNGKRVYSQDMKIEQSNNVIYLIIKEDNMGEKKLTLTKVNNSTAIFENEEIGNPHKIIYKKEGNRLIEEIISLNDTTEMSTALIFTKD